MKKNYFVSDITISNIWRGGGYKDITAKAVITSYSEGWCNSAKSGGEMGSKP